MKAPINFNDKVHRLDIKANGTEYVLEVQEHSDNKVWVYPNIETRNVIRIEFDWKFEAYRVQISRTGDGLNFFKDLQWYGFERNSFTTFGGFVEWMRELIGTCERLFNYGG